MPVFQVQRIDNGQMRFIPNDGTVSMTDTTFTSSAAALAGFPIGPVLVRVWVNGVPSASLYSVLSTGNAAGVIPTSERAVLINIYNSTHGDGWTKNINWCSGACPSTGTPTFNASGTECTWYGVTCDATKSHVTEIFLTTNNLSGTLPALDGLTNLTQFGVSQNHLSGGIPALAELSDLQVFYADFNQLSGTIPSLAGLAALSAFEASGNQLSGSIPPLSGSTNLVEFLVDRNQLTGNIPSLSGLSALQFFRVGSNRLSGGVPVAPSALLAGQSTLCPNPLTISSSANDTAWNDATGTTPLKWWQTPYVNNTCDEVFTSRFED
jgi:hypothetical protein